MGGHWEVADAGREIIQNWFDQAALANDFRPLDVRKTTAANGSITYTLLGSAGALHLSEFQKEW